MGRIFGQLSNSEKAKKKKKCGGLETPTLKGPIHQQSC